MASKKQTSRRPTRRKAAIADVQFETRSVKIEDLLLDPNNPRLQAAEHGSNQQQLLETMAARFNLEDLAESIITSGWLNLDPIVGFRDKTTKITVLEGNRRVATIKLLLNPEEASPKRRSSWQLLSSKITAHLRAQISVLPVSVCDNRDAASVLAYIGYRHVSGVMEWKPPEKAAYIAKLVEDYNWSYQEIAERLGSWPAHIEKHYVAHRLVMQAQEEELPGANQMRSQFGVLMRALQSPGIRTFMEVDYPGDSSKSKRPSHNIENLADTIRWLFGTDEQREILEDSRDLTIWGKILSSEAAVQYLRGTPNPSYRVAQFKAGAERTAVVESLENAADRLQEAVPLVPRHKKEKALHDAVERCADFLSQILISFPEIKKSLDGVEE